MTKELIPQSVRDAAADFATKVLPDSDLARATIQALRDGNSDDCDFAQAFANYRAIVLEEAAKVAIDEAATDEADGEIWIARRIHDRILALRDPVRE